NSTIILSNPPVGYSGTTSYPKTVTFYDQAFINLPAGDYVVNVADSVCSRSATISITAPVQQCPMALIDTAGNLVTFAASGSGVASQLVQPGPPGTIR